MTQGILVLRTAHWQPYRLPLRAAWSTAAGGFAWREGWLLRLETEEGLYGYGDCAPLPAMGTETLAQAAAALHAQAPTLLGQTVETSLAALLDPTGNSAPAARCALECALLDLAAQAARQPLARFLMPGASDAVRVNAALGSALHVDDQTLVSAVAQGFGVLKLKVGCAPVDEELARLRALAAQLPSRVQLRLDANRAWRIDEARHFIESCADLPIEMLEEPLADPQPERLRRLQALCAFPLALDESGPTMATLEAFVDAPPVRRLVLKPPRLGGLLPALALARRARAAGIECVVTSSVDSACGVLAAAHLAAALEGIGNGLAHGLATSCWLAEDLGTAPPILAGHLRLPPTAGLGFVPGNTNIYRMRCCN